MDNPAGKWVHLFCALMVPGVNFGDPDRMTGIDVKGVRREVGSACGACACGAERICPLLLGVWTDLQCPLCFLFVLFFTCTSATN